MCSCGHAQEVESFMVIVLVVQSRDWVETLEYLN